MEKEKSVIAEMIEATPVEAGIIQDFRIELAERIARRLEINGVSQSELARKMGVFRSVVSDIVRGKKNVTLSTMAKISVGLGWDLLRNDSINPCKLIGTTPIKVDDKCMICRLDNRKYLVLPLINAEALVDELMAENIDLTARIDAAFFAGAKVGYEHGTEKNLLQNALTDWKGKINY